MREIINGHKVKWVKQTIIGDETIPVVRDDDCVYFPFMFPYAEDWFYVGFSLNEIGHIKEEIEEI